MDQDIHGSLSARALGQYVSVWSRMQNASLNQEIADKFIWKWSSNQQYSAASAYRAFFHDHCAISGAKKLSKMVALARCKFFVWLALLDRC
jgi:hypothetical protein